MIVRLPKDTPANLLDLQCGSTILFLYNAERFIADIIVSQESKKNIYSSLFCSYVKIKIWMSIIYK